jgi:hypothetical protein
LIGNPSSAFLEKLQSVFFNLHFSINLVTYLIRQPDKD